MGWICTRKNVECLGGFRKLVFLGLTLEIVINKCELRKLKSYNSYY